MRPNSLLFVFFSYHFNNFSELVSDVHVVLSAMGLQTVRTILDATFQIDVIATAFIAKGIEGAVAEHTAECFWICVGMAGEIFTFFVLVKIVMYH